MKDRIPLEEQFQLLKLPSNRARFEAKVSPEPNSGCWLWEGAVGQFGHGQIFLKGQSAKGVINAHRAAWMMHRGRLATGDVVCHKCDNPYCVNPFHLFVGTQKDNMRDARRKGRMKLPKTVGAYNSQAVLSDEQVISIRLSPMPMGALADEFGVSRTTIWQVKSGDTWPHLPFATPPRRRKTVLTPEQQKEIASSPLHPVEVAKAYGCAWGTVYAIRKRFAARAA